MHRTLFFVSLMFIPYPLAAAQIALSDDGREVVLQDEGSWQFASEDRFATTEDGRRIRLLSDGSWVEVDDDRKWLTVPAQALQLSRDSVSQGNLRVELEEVSIESVRTKQQKNSRLRTQIVANLKISSESQTNRELDPQAFVLTDSRGRDYPVIALSAARLNLAPGKAVDVVLYADGAPRWWGVKYFRLEIEPGALSDGELELTKSMSEVQKLDVEALSSP